MRFCDALFSPWSWRSIVQIREALKYRICRPLLLPLVGVVFWISDMPIDFKTKIELSTAPLARLDINMTVKGFRIASLSDGAVRRQTGRPTAAVIGGSLKHPHRNAVHALMSCSAGARLDYKRAIARYAPIEQRLHRRKVRQPSLAPGESTWRRLIPATLRCRCSSTAQQQRLSQWLGLQWLGGLHLCFGRSGAGLSTVNTMRSTRKIKADCLESRLYGALQ